MKAWERPAWRPDRARESLRELTGWLNARARETFLEDHAHAELLFFIRPGGDIEVELAPPELARDHLLEIVRTALRDPAVVGLVHIFEAWTYFAPPSARSHPAPIALGGPARFRVAAGRPARGADGHAACARWRRALLEQSDPARQRRAARA